MGMVVLPDIIHHSDGDKMLMEQLINDVLATLISKSKACELEWAYHNQEPSLNHTDVFELQYGQFHLILSVNHHISILQFFKIVKGHCVCIHEVTHHDYSRITELFIVLMSHKANVSDDIHYLLEILKRCAP